jgi:hypothetical protein
MHMYMYLHTHYLIVIFLIGPTIVEAAKMFIQENLSKLSDKFHTKFLKYIQYDPLTIKETYYLLRQTYLQKCTVDPYYGPSLSLENFSNIVMTAELLTEADGEFMCIYICKYICTYVYRFINLQIYVYIFNFLFLEISSNIIMTAELLTEADGEFTYKFTYVYT